MDRWGVSMSSGLAILVVVLAVIVVGGLVVLIRTRRVVATPTERAVHAALHTASLAAPVCYTQLRAPQTKRHIAYGVVCL